MMIDLSLKPLAEHPDYTLMTSRSLNGGIDTVNYLAKHKALCGLVVDIILYPAFLALSELDPEDTGLRLIKHARALMGDNLPIVAISGVDHVDGFDLEEESIKAGADVFYPKTMGVSEFRHGISELFGVSENE